MRDGTSLAKSVLIALVILIIAVFAFVAYSGYSSRQHHSSDAVTVAPAPEGGQGKMPSGSETPAAPFSSSDPAKGAEVTSTGAGSANGMVPPASDSIQADPPNGMTFGGSGHYQLYRQGNLTWRLNTDTGQTCIVFATEEEWRKPQVFRAGCRGR